MIENRVRKLSLHRERERQRGRRGRERKREYIYNIIRNGAETRVRYTSARNNRQVFRAEYKVGFANGVYARRPMLTEIRPRGKNSGAVISIGYAEVQSNPVDVY